VVTTGQLKLNRSVESTSTTSSPSHARKRGLSYRATKIRSPIFQFGGPCSASVAKPADLLVDSRRHQSPVRSFPRSQHDHHHYTIPGCQADLIKGFRCDQQAVASSRGIETLPPPRAERGLVTLNLRLDANPIAPSRRASKECRSKSVLPRESRIRYVVKQTGETTALMYLPSTARSWAAPR